MLKTKEKLNGEIYEGIDIYYYCNCDIVPICAANTT